MDEFGLDVLQANPKNPRTINKHDFEKLVQSIKRFGDLSGIVLNTVTGQLVGGHQRVQAFKQLGGRPIVTERFEQPNSKGTVALGYVLLEDERYAYREVEWDANLETAANIAANRIQGEFDTNLLAQLNYELSQLENADELLALTGQTDDEIKKLLGDVSGEGEDDKYTKEIVAPTYEPSGEKPNVADLVSLEHTNKLLAEIETAPIDETDKQLLRLAAYRHNIFDYGKIADYYAHSSAEVQNLMENSALIIIDYNKAVELGYVKVTKEVSDAQAKDYTDDEE